MKYEIDFLPVGDNSKSGDAIAIRFGEILEPGHQTVIVVDGGTRKSGAALVDHIKKYYGQVKVDHVFLTHHHNDHSAGLQDVIEGLDVRNLWMHKPWDLSHEMLKFIDDQRRTHNSVSDYLIESLQNSVAIHDIAIEKGIPIREPFPDSLVCPNVHILGPDIEYLAMCSAKIIDQSIKTESLFQKGFEAISEAVKKFLTEKFDIDLLKEPTESEQNCINDSSVILLLTLSDRPILLPGDAGPFALERALRFAHKRKLPTQFPSLFKLSHHGSKHNIGPKLCDYLFGDIDLKYMEEDTQHKGTAIASVAVHGKPKHPSFLVTNALIRRGYKVIETAGTVILHRRDAPQRSGWTPVPPIPFTTTIEED